MSSLLASIASSGDALRVFQRALGVIQNNVDNASTPGYATQQAALTALPLDIAGGLAGGVAMRSVETSRNEFADEEVRRQLQRLGQYSAQSQNLDSVENLFDVTGNSGVPADLTKLFQAFSAWSANPGDPSVRQAVLDSADAIADSVRSLSHSLADQASGLDSQVVSTIQQINTLAGEVQKYNVQRLENQTPDPGADATLHANLESLSQLTNITSLIQADGTVTVLAGGSAPLVIGNHQFSLSSSVSVDSTPAPANPKSRGTARVLDWQGNEITGDIASGQLGGILDVRNRVLASISGDARQPGLLNRFAKTLADSVNQTLQAGMVSSASGAAAGSALFSYDTSDATLSAGSLKVTSIGPQELAPVDSTGTSNGNAIQLASLANTTQAALGGLSLTGFLSQIAANAGQESQTAKTNTTAQQQTAAQARSVRDQISGVSLDAEAIKLIEFQRGYQAAARVLAVLSDLTDKTIQMIP
jgi:flagellar hook-associated protein 1 FlgK